MPSDTHTQLVKIRKQQQQRKLEAAGGVKPETPTLVDSLKTGALNFAINKGLNILTGKAGPIAAYVAGLVVAFLVRQLSGYGIELDAKEQAEIYGTITLIVAGAINAAVNWVQAKRAAKVQEVLGGLKTDGVLKEVTLARAIELKDYATAPKAIPVSDEEWAEESRVALQAARKDA